MLQLFGVIGGNLFTDGLLVSEDLCLRHPSPALWYTGKINNRIKTVIKCLIQNGSWAAPNGDRIDFLVVERVLWPDFLSKCINKILLILAISRLPSFS